MSLDSLSLPHLVTMPNGVPLYLLKGTDKGVVRFDLLFKGGYAIQSKPLLAMFTNRMLREGTTSLTATEISYRLDYYGAWIEMYSSQNCNHITLYTMAKHFVPLLQVLEDMVKHPLFPKENLETVKSTNKAHFSINSRKVDVVSQRYFENSLWGSDHPLGHVVEATDYDAITREDILDYYNSHYGSCNCTMFVSGSVDETMLESLKNSFGSIVWGCEEKCLSVDVAMPNPIPGRRFVQLQDTMQSAVKIGFMAMSSVHPDFYKFRFLCVLLGGYFGSRLMSNIREENGYTYHISAELDAYGDRNAFMISSETAHEYVEPLINEVYREIDRLITERVEESEIELVRNYIMGELCREYEGQSAKSEVFINTWLSGVGFETVNNYLNEIKSVTADDLQRLAREYLKKENMIEVVVGK